MRLRLAALSVALLGLVIGALPAAASSSDLSTVPGRYYLSLGDSLAFGYQQALINKFFPEENPNIFHTGYTNEFAELLNHASPGIRTINYGCPGETTDSMINGPCPYPFGLHDAYTASSQLGSAIAFLDSHPNQVSPITIDIGSNDTTNALLPTCLDPTQASECQAKVAGLVSKLTSNLVTIIGALHLASPSSEIIVLNLYNPLAAQFPLLASLTDFLAGQLNQMISETALASGARVADVFSIFNPTGPSEGPTLCTLTAICTSLQDSHPTNVGYIAMANALWLASGYTARND